MDITMPGLNGLQATSLIKSQHPDIGILVLSMSGDEESIDQAIQAGVNGYLVKETAASELLAAIRELRKGNAFFSPSVSKVLLERERGASDRLSPGSLTYREKVIIQLIADGKTTKEIGGILNISPKTVDKHRQQIMEKLDIHDVASLTRYAITKGIVR
jgi:DNA-binding NarL/FixJ family response regulator